MISFITYSKYYKKDDSITKIKVAEVTHSIFYAPWYVAIEKDFFKEYNIEIDLVLTPGADNVAAAVLSNDVKIGFAGPESTIYVYKGGEKDYLQSFAGLTKRDGQFIVGREQNDNFSLNELVDKEVLVGRIGGMPFLNFENALLNNGVSKEKVTMNSSVDFADLTSAFISGTGDYVNLFEPNATLLEKEGFGFVVASVGKFSGEVPYTSFYARKSYLKENKALVRDFTRALNKGLEFVQKNSPKEIAQVILAQFPNTSLTDLEAMLSRYKDADSWLDNTKIVKKYFNNLQDIMINAGNLDKYVPYSDLINNH